MPFRRTRVVVVAVLSLAATIAMGSRVADAGDSSEPLTVTVDRPTPGAALTVEGHRCDGFKVLLSLTKGHVLVLDFEIVFPDEEGSWSGTLTIPDRDDLVGKTLTISAKCIGDDTEYLPAQIVVVPEEDTPPPSTPPTAPPPPPGGGDDGTPPPPGGGDGAGGPSAPGGTGPGGAAQTPTAARTPGAAPAVNGAPTFTG